MLNIPIGQIMSHFQHFVIGMSETFLFGRSHVRSYLQLSPYLDSLCALSLLLKLKLPGLYQT